MEYLRGIADTTDHKGMKNRIDAMLRNLKEVRKSCGSKQEKQP